LKRPRTPERRAGRADPGDDGEDSEGRAPLPRRPQQWPAPRDRGTKGDKKRERAREFTKEKTEERRAAKWQKGWKSERKGAGKAKGHGRGKAACSSTGSRGSSFETSPTETRHARRGRQPWDRG